MDILIKQFNERPGTIICAGLGGVVGIASAFICYKLNKKRATPYIKNYEKGKFLNYKLMHF